MPTMVSVVMNTAAIVTVAPASSSDAVKGKDIRAGICRKEPITATIMTALIPDCSPMSIDIRAGGINPSNNPMNTIIARIVGIICMNELAVLMSASFVLSLS